MAISDERALVGWTFVDDAEFGNVFRFVAKHLPGPVELVFSCKSMDNKIESDGRKLEAVGFHGQDRLSTRAERLDAVEMAAFSNYPWALFFSSSHVGVGTAEVAALLNSPAHLARSEHPCGTLMVEQDEVGSLRAIRFSQGANDRLTARALDKGLEDYESPLFEGGLVRVNYSTVFDSPLGSHPSAPWSADCACEHVGANGHVSRVAYRVTVTDASFDEARVDREIDAILGLIPEGERVQSIGPIEYVWERQNVVRRVDSEAVAVANRLGLAGEKRSPFRMLLLALGLALLAIVGFLIRRKSRHVT
ncbi:MAG TPA: hypothetical protein VND64_24235 [Pirellulales bacterium]|nr:hypothetical protein [Pirellulales bacterium]